MIADDLDRSPFIGEGHRPVRARLRIAGVRVSRRRVLRPHARARPALPATRPER